MMKHVSKIARRTSALLALTFALGCAQPVLADSVYLQHNLVSDGAPNLTADHTDANLSTHGELHSGSAVRPGSPTMAPARRLFTTATATRSR